MKCDLIDMFPVEMKFDVEVVAAQWVMADRMMTCVIQRAVIPRLPVVIEDDLLIE